ncbi:cytosolic endo-beta-N-acetylglucosaminidase isoform X1 [Falco biarmicus]|uniref:cytosolic endo-beta-N-acetylglucosaminidase n=1 Tax=Falco rusticolus TaxID=120794 RepID=UPI00188688E0|nr:cytosolic endo-beta-N-acetylglucosaminidase [Falco rusticolus]XP_055552905.1 cytosolic endo-beta-N-acetylglucosaminidase isoform X1 [Falco cherrug]XP_056218726.1 cytosolic endo-beta-N-acetylglucosaminidase isoform X1 [Falco biarmicus]
MAAAAAQEGPARRGKRAGTEAPAEAEAERAERRRRSFQPAAEPRGTTVLHDTVSARPQPLPARHFDTSTTEPISFSLSGLEELLSWQPDSNDDFNVSAVPLAERQPPLGSQRPRTLVCHDMRGGYLEDRFIQGSATRNPYVFYHWRYIDVFIYFSHHTVTIPPVCWTNAAHRNGVTVLGTFITEWTDGEKLCESFLAGGEEAYHAVSEQLARIAQHYRFDGWLVNIENMLSAAAARNLPAFLRHLTVQVHSAMPGGLVIWYDSVLQNGTLRWQNELNEENRVFFDACDGLFTNYNWKEEHLERTCGLAGPRRTDVYVGIDVFARGDVVGGGFDTDKSLRLIRQHGLSAAIFAPGWVYEHLGEENFLHNENKFWGSLSEYLPTHSICTLPLTTSFSLGMGTSRFLAGMEEEAGPWYDLSAQEIQPLYPEHKGRLSTSCCLQDAWCGGSSLRLQGTIPAGEERVAIRLFSLQMLAPPKLLLTMVYKLEGPHPDELMVALELTTWDSRTCHEGNITSLPEPNSRHHPRLLPAPPPRLAELLAACDRSSHGWTGRCYELDLQDCSLRDLSLLLSCHQPSLQETPFTCLLGEIRVLDAASVVASPPQVQSLTASQLWWQEGPEAKQLSLSLTLRWAFPPNRASCFRILSQGARCREGQTPLQFLGLAHACLYRVVGLVVPQPAAGQSCRLELLVEPVLRDELPVDPDRWGRLVLVYSEPASSTSRDGH